MFVGIPKLVMSQVGMSLNSHGILQIGVVVRPGPCRQHPQHMILPKVTVTEVGSTQSMLEETILWNENGEDWSFPLVTMVMPLQERMHPTVVVTLWVDDSIVTRRLANLPRRGESLVSQVELVYPCLPYNNGQRSASSMYRWIQVLLLVGLLSRCSSILLPVLSRPRRLSAHVVEPPMVVRHRFFVDDEDDESEHPQESLQDPFYASETDQDDNDDEEGYSESIVEDETTTGSGSNCTGDAQDPQCPEEMLSLQDESDLDPALPIPDDDDLEIVDLSEKGDQGVDGSHVALVAATGFDCLLTHESNRVNLPNSLHNDDDNDNGLPPSTNVDMVVSTRSLPLGEGNNTLLISPSTLDEHSGKLSCNSPASA